ncbi:MAG: hypothetical protein FJY65_06840 [Calditrichaeota bacterium]|nr:hypothetical protein [Calditrichota bacterium]
MKPSNNSQNTRSRLARDRELFNLNRRGQLAETIARSNPNVVAGAIYKALECQIIAEEFIRHSCADSDEAAPAKFQAEHREEIAREVDKAVMSFIGAIVSQEGG